MYTYPPMLWIHLLNLHVAVCGHLRPPDKNNEIVKVYVVVIVNTIRQKKELAAAIHTTTTMNLSIE